MTHQTDQERAEWRAKQKAPCPGEGWSPNPLLMLGKDDPCPCGVKSTISDERKTWGSCHGPEMVPWIPTEHLALHYAMMGREMPLNAVRDDGKMNPTFYIERRPSNITGISWWAVLEYGETKFDELLPADFIGMEEADRDLAMAPVRERLRLKLKPILEAEDA